MLPFWFYICCNWDFTTFLAQNNLEDAQPTCVCACMHLGACVTLSYSILCVHLYLGYVCVVHICECACSSPYVHTCWRHRMVYLLLSLSILLLGNRVFLTRSSPFSKGAWPVSSCDFPNSATPLHLTWPHPNTKVIDTHSHTFNFYMAEFEFGPSYMKSRCFYKLSHLFIPSIGSFELLSS